MSLREITLSSFFILHVFWMAVKVLRFVTYIGLLNAWIQALFNKDTEKGKLYKCKLYTHS